ncbi:MAG: hypothetical protein RJA57_252, partial [Bacteroidota bacterium]
DYATFQVAMLAGVRSAADKITGMNTLVRKFPGSPLVTDAQLEVANTYMGNEKFREAIPYLEKVIEAGRNRAVVATALLKLGTAFYNTDNNPAALKQFRLLVTGYPNAPETGDALDYIRTIYIEDGKPDAYAAFMREIDRPLTISTEDSLTYQAAEKLFDAQKVMEALAAFGAYLERFPRGAHALDAHYRMAVLCLQKKDWSRALPSLEAVLAEVPNRYAEPAALAAARTTFFEIKDPVRAEGFYVQLKQFSTTQENRLEAMRGLLRCQYRQQKWKEAQENARELSEIKGSSTDDRSLAQMAIARSLESDGQFDQAIPYFRTVIQLNRSALAAEARYAIAQCWFRLNKLSDSEKAAFETINRSGSYDHWITRAYLLLGDIYLRQKDYFNAKATFQSVAANASEPPLQEEARTKLERVNVEEAAAGKLNQ